MERYNKIIKTKKGYKPTHYQVVNNQMVITYTKI